MSPIWAHSPTNPDKIAKLIADVAEFVCTVANLKCLDALKNGAKHQSFLELIVGDGDATFSSSYGCSSSLYERRVDEHHRRILEERIEALCRFCDRYRFLLSAMSRTYCECGMLDESIDLYPIVAIDDLPSGGYFVRISLAEAVNGMSSISTLPQPVQWTRQSEDKVTVGGFAIELSRLLESPIEQWIKACEAKLELLVPMREDERDRVQRSNRDVYRKQALRKRLVRMLSEHIAMVGLFVASSDGPAILLERQQSPMNTSLMETLISEFADDAVCTECEELRCNSITQLRLLLALCCNSDDLAQLVTEHQVSFLIVLRTQPSVLVRRPGYSSCDFRFHTLRSIVMSTTSATHSLTIVQLREWRHSIGRSSIGQLERYLNEAISILTKQRFPDHGFLPTLRNMEPPPPTWCDPSGASDIYMFTRSSVPLVPMRSEAYIQIPSSTEQILRLISLVWEMLAYEDTRDFFFTPGRISARFLREVISIEQVNVAFAAMTLSAWKQKCGLGQTYRHSAAAISHFRGSEIEAHIRESFSRLCNWSLVDILSVVSEEQSPSFLATQWKLIDAVSQHMRVLNPTGMTVQCSSVLGRVLDVVEPIVIAIRSDTGLRSIARPHPLADLLRTIPAIRNWDGTSSELILTCDDVMQSKSTKIRELLKSLSAQHSIVHYGKLSRGRTTNDHGYGSKRVFRFNGFDLSNVLFGELLG